MCDNGPLSWLRALSFTCLLLLGQSRSIMTDVASTDGRRLDPGIRPSSATSRVDDRLRWPGTAPPRSQRAPRPSASPAHASRRAARGRSAAFGVRARLGRPAASRTHDAETRRCLRPSRPAYLVRPAPVSSGARVSTRRRAPRPLRRAIAPVPIERNGPTPARCTVAQATVAPGVPARSQPEASPARRPGSLGAWRARYSCKSRGANADRRT